MTLEEEIRRRRTFAIISHPDAGKTTLTEKLLLFGGAIHVAGAVKSNKIKKTATSDWMEIEKQRGISVATSVMGFEYRDFKINILDTPGHQDFAEDTFRTLTAVDSVIIVIDSAKGVETQTRKLMQVCRMRKTPVMVFMNKMDREGRDPFDLLDEIEAELGIKVRPLTWPINMGFSFKGVYNIYRKNLNLYTPNKQTVSETVYCGAVQSAGKLARAVAWVIFLKLLAGVAASSPKEQVEVQTGVVVKEAVTRQVTDESDDSESRQRQRVRVVAGPSSQPLRQTRSE